MQYVEGGWALINHCLLLTANWITFLCRENSIGDIASEQVSSLASRRPGCFKFFDAHNGVEEPLCKLNNGEIVQVLIGAIKPKLAPRHDWIVNLCQNGKCVPADLFSTYDDSQWEKFKHGIPPPPIGFKDYRLRDHNAEAVTNVVIEQGFDPNKLLTAWMTSSTKSFAKKYWPELPAPFVILRPYLPSGFGMVYLQPNEDKSRYGDLLNHYYIGNYNYTNSIKL